MAKFTVEDIKRIAGLPYNRALLEAKGNSAIDHDTPEADQFGHVVVVQGDAAKVLSKLLRIKKDGKLVPVGAGFAAFDGKQVGFFEHEEDHNADDWALNALIVSAQPEESEDDTDAKPAKDDAAADVDASAAVDAVPEE